MFASVEDFGIRLDFIVFAKNVAVSKDGQPFPAC